MFYARIDQQKTKLGIANRNVVLRGAKTEHKVTPTEKKNISHLKKKKAPSSYKSN